jgi:hypothetical protein
MKMKWKRARHEAGQQDGDALKRLKFCMQTMERQEFLFDKMMHSDEKVFALSENQEGGYYCDEDELAPMIMKWQGEVKLHVWGGVTAKGPLPLIFLKGGTFKGQAAWDRDMKKLYVEKAKQAYVYAAAPISLSTCGLCKQINMLPPPHVLSTAWAAQPPPSWGR